MKQFILVSLLILCVGCSHQTLKTEEIKNSALQNATNSTLLFQNDSRLQPFFKDAVAYAILPTIVRGGTGLGYAYGSGWVYEKQADTHDYALAGKVITNQVNVGAQLGLQVYSQIIFFENQTIYKKFRRGNFEFAGQAYAAFLIWGGGATPAYNQSVAVFSDITGGLLLEASVGGHRYDFIAIDSSL